MAISLHGTGGDDESAGGLFDDKDTRSFYETLPDLKAVLPAVLFGEGGEAVAPTLTPTLALTLTLTPTPTLALSPTLSPTLSLSLPLSRT